MRLRKDVLKLDNLASITSRKTIATRVLNYGKMISKDFKRNKLIYLLATPGILYFIIFLYVPMYGLIIAFKDYIPSVGIFESPWVGFRHFYTFFQSFYFTRILRNTVLLSFYSILWGFPAPIILALLLNEIRQERFKRTVQTVSYLPHFISMVIVCGMITQFSTTNGLINTIIAFFGGQRSNLLARSEMFRTIFVSSEVWQQIGWGSIIYLAALSNVDLAQYDAATVDGANRWQKLVHVTIPAIIPTIVIMLILRIGRMMNISFERVILLYNPLTYQTADVISSFVYRKGILEASYSYSTAVGLFNSVINFILLYSANKISKMVNETSLW